MGFVRNEKLFKNEVFALGGQRRTEMPKGTIWRLTHGNKMASSSTSITQEQQCCTLLSGMRKNCFHVKNAILGFSNLFSNHDAFYRKIGASKNTLFVPSAIHLRACSWICKAIAIFQMRYKTIWFNFSLQKQMSHIASLKLYEIPKSSTRVWDFFCLW